MYVHCCGKCDRCVVCVAAFLAIRAAGFDAIGSVPTIATAHPNCECERESVSEFSTGVVGNDEIVCRLVFSEHHFDTASNSPKPGLFDDVFSRGASAYRSPGMSYDEIHILGRQREANNRERGHVYIGFVAAICRRVRDEIRYPANDDARRMCVYDTALEDQRHHVDIFSATAINNLAADRTLKQALRNALVDLFVQMMERAPAQGEAA